MTSATIATVNHPDNDGSRRQADGLAVAVASRTRPTPRALLDYLGRVMGEFGAANRRAGTPNAEAALPAAIFALQTRREFCYLSHARAEHYRDAAQRWISHWVLRDEPVRYYLDIGGGYHASVRPGVDDVCFDVGLSELLLLAQIRRFDTQVRQVYAPGIRFTLVIDNLCARLVNDIDVEPTSAYCSRLRALIGQLDLTRDVDLLVESEHFSVDDLTQLAGATSPGTDTDSLTRKEHDTVERFLGRACEADEAAERTARYRRIIDVSGQLIDGMVEGLRMTQRATPQTLCFRSFPGGDSRMQSGQVGLRLSATEAVRPVLLTSHNQHGYDWYRVDASAIVPAAVGPVICAEPLPG